VEIVENLETALQRFRRAAGRVESGSSRLRTGAWRRMQSVMVFYYLYRQASLTILAERNTHSYASEISTLQRGFRNRGKTRGVIAGLVPGDLDQDGAVPDYRDGRDKPGHDQMGTARSFASLTGFRNRGKTRGGSAWSCTLIEGRMPRLSPFYHDAATICLRHETNVRHVRRLAGLTPVPKPYFARVTLLDEFFHVI